MCQSDVQALILAGGSGTRFWPSSRRHRPKQLLPLDGDRSLLRATLERLQPLIPPSRVWVCTTRRLAEAVRDELPEVPASQILCEPEGRNTAAAIGWAVRSMPESVRTGVVAVLPADHRVADTDAFRATLAAAATAAEHEVDGRELVLTLGVTPHRPETGYGYLELGAELDAETSLRRVARFREKPDLATAERFLAAGGYLWNAGIFVFRGELLLRLLQQHLPGLAAGLEAIASAPEQVATLYGSLPATSIDFGLMEKLDNIAALPLDCGWSDLGSWQALHEVLTEVGAVDARGNACRGDVLVAGDARDNLLVADAGTVAVVGVEGLVVVRTDDAVLVMPRERAQEVRAIVDQLEAGERETLL